MATLVELARSHTRLTADDAAHLQRLAAAWGMLADLCFADLLLLAPVAGEEGHRFVVLAQVRPTTDQTLYRDDMVGTMLYEGTFPFKGGAQVQEETPRVGDGVLVLDTESTVRYASPNAVSSLHRMGIHTNAQGQRLSDIGLDDDAVRTAFAARAPVTEELEWGDTSILLQVIPLLEEGNPNGALLLMRDVSELRRRDRMLLSKDATIREIHHRVKNNL